MSLYEELSEEDRKLCRKLRTMLDAADYKRLVVLAEERLKQEIDLSSSDGVLLKAEIANLLIDAGSEGQIEEAIKRGLDIYKKDYSQLAEKLTEGSIEYNIGNAKLSLYDLRRLGRNSQRYLQGLELLTEAKNHYWRSLNEKKSPEQIKVELVTPEASRHRRDRLLVNLGNALSKAGRIAEALQYYDMVLRRSPAFPQANASRAVALITLSSLSTATTNLIWQAYEGYRLGARGEAIPPRLRELWSQRAEALKSELRRKGHTLEEAEIDAKEAEEEYAKHSSYRKFALDHFLSLSEHSLYCQCRAARKDELTVSTSAWPIAGDFIPRMEHRLNRMKSEFALARHAYYEATQTQEGELAERDKDVAFTELYEGEALGLRSEMLRTSFRMCFGILDKIALSICELFELPIKENDHVYFHNFWKKPSRQWWDQLKDVEGNSPLAALYSQATDLSIHSRGEWALYKEWRDSLEHGFLVLKEFREASDMHGALESDLPLEIVSLTHFEQKALHMLQFTRSAIFNFAFCARVEGWKEHGQVRDNIGMTQRLQPRSRL